MRIRNRDRLFLFSYFVAIILLGSGLLSLPAAWGGPRRLAYIDALFTSTSAVCVTGLTAVDTSLYTAFGKLVILLLIQFGGLGIITFLTIFLAAPRARISFASRKLVGDYFVSSVESNPRKIARSVVAFTLIIELAGAVILWTAFRRTVSDRAPFVAVFHAISAFCNAGFSTFSSNLEGFVAEPVVCITVIALVILGGIGFVVMEDVVERALGRRRRLSLHTRLVLAMTASLLLAGAAVYAALEWSHGYASLSPGQKVMAAIFQSVTPRTAGFDTVPQAALTFPSRVFTLFLMYVGASPASTGGGIKTTTFFVILVMILRGSEAREDVRLVRRKLSSQSVARGMMFALRALAIVAVAVLLLTFTELLVRPGPAEQKHFLAVLFETFSAFGTVGLSLGLTPYLTAAGKCIIILTMFAGRVGMSALAISTPRRLRQHAVDYPEEEVLVG